VLVIQFDLLDTKQIAQFRLIPETVLERALRVLLTEVDVEAALARRFRQKRDQVPQPWDWNPLSVRLIVTIVDPAGLSFAISELREPVNERRRAQ
jgi:hypothetical protein